MINRQYLKDITINEDENDYRAYTLVDGKNVLNHGHWEYLYDDGNVHSKGTFIDGYQEGAWQVSYPNGSPLRRNFFLRGDFFPEVPLMGDETIMVPKMEYYDIEYNSFNEIEDEKARIWKVLQECILKERLIARFGSSWLVNLKETFIMVLILFVLSLLFYDLTHPNLSLEIKRLFFFIDTGCCIIFLTNFFPKFLLAESCAHHNLTSIAKPYSILNHESPFTK